MLAPIAQIAVFCPAVRFRDISFSLSRQRLVQAAPVGPNTPALGGLRHDYRASALSHHGHCTASGTLHTPSLQVKTRGQSPTVHGSPRCGCAAHCPPLQIRPGAHWMVAPQLLPICAYATHVLLAPLFTQCEPVPQGGEQPAGSEQMGLFAVGT